MFDDQSVPLTSIVPLQDYEEVHHPSFSDLVTDQPQVHVVTCSLRIMMVIERRSVVSGDLVLSGASWPRPHCVRRSEERERAHTAEVRA